MLFLGWEGASNTAYTAEQLPYVLSGGIGGALLVALGATLLISADLRDEWHKLDRIETQDQKRQFLMNLICFASCAVILLAGSA